MNDNRTMGMKCECKCLEMMSEFFAHCIEKSVGSHYEDVDEKAEFFKRLLKKHYPAGVHILNKSYVRAKKQEEHNDLNERYCDMEKFP